MQSIITAIKAGEDSYNEFKTASFHNESLAKEIVAFSNRRGGSIWIGIEDNGDLTGVEDNKIEERIIN